MCCKHKQYFAFFIFSLPLPLPHRRTQSAYLWLKQAKISKFACIQSVLLTNDLHVYCVWVYVYVMTIFICIPDGFEFQKWNMPASAFHAYNDSIVYTELKAKQSNEVRTKLCHIFWTFYTNGRFHFIASKKKKKKGDRKMSAK